MQYTIKLTYGDPSYDGHGIYDSDFYKSNYRTSEIVSAVESIEAKNSFIFERDICSDYGECTINSDMYDQFFSMGIDIGNYVDKDEDSYYVHDFTGLYLAIAKLALPDLETEFFNPATDSIDIGGYGMFGN